MQPHQRANQEEGGQPGAQGVGFGDCAPPNVQLSDVPFPRLTLGQHQQMPAAARISQLTLHRALELGVTRCAYIRMRTESTNEPGATATQEGVTPEMLNIQYNTHAPSDPSLHLQHISMHDQVLDEPQKRQVEAQRPEMDSLDKSATASRKKRKTAPLASEDAVLENRAEQFAKELSELSDIIDTRHLKENVDDRTLRTQTETVVIHLTRALHNNSISELDEQDVIHAGERLAGVLEFAYPVDHSKSSGVKQIKGFLDAGCCLIDMFCHEQTPARAYTESSLMSALNFFSKVCLYDLVLQKGLDDTSLLVIQGISLPCFSHNALADARNHSVDVLREIFILYPAHRARMLSEVLDCFGESAANKRSANRRYRISSDISISPVSALIMQLFLGCSRVNARVELEDDDDDLPVDLHVASEENADRAARRFSSITTIASTFVQEFITRCKKKNSEVDWKKRFLLIVTDNIALLGFPEWPCAEFLLQVVSKCVMTEIESPEVDDKTRSWMIEILGLLLSAITARSRLVRMEDLLAGPEADLEAVQAEYPCVCQSAVSGEAFMLDCDHCHKWFHGQCVGISSEDILETWMCELCRLHSRMGAAPSDNGGPDIADEQSQLTNEICRMQLMLYLRSQGCNDAAQFCCSYWSYIDSLEVDEYPLLYKATGESKVTELFALQISRHLGTISPLAGHQKALMQKLLAALNEPSISMRKKATQALSSVVKADDLLLLDPRVTKAIGDRILDKAIGVREAIVDMLGTYMINNPQVAEKYYNRLTARLVDLGVSVRKRAVKILARICGIEACSSLHVDALKRLALRLQHDERPVRRLVRKVFHELWYTGAAPEEHRDALQMRTRQFAQVVGSEELPIDDLAEHWAIKTARKLVRKAKNERAAAAVVSAYTQMAQLLVTQIVTEDKQDVASWRALAVLTELCPEVVVDYLGALSVRLDSLMDPKLAKLTSTVIGVLEKAIPHINASNTEVLEQLEALLVSTIANHSSITVVFQAVRCLCASVTISKHSKILCDLYGTFYAPLIKNQSPAQMLERPIFLLGVLCRFFPFDTFRNIPDEVVTPVHRLKKSDLIIRPLALFFSFAKRSEANLQMRAAEAVGNICVGRPELLDKASPLFVAVINNKNAHGSSPHVLFKALGGLRDILVQERISYRKGAHEQGDATKAISGEDFYDSAASVSRSVVSKVMEGVLACVGGHPSHQVRSMSLLLLEEIMRQGYGHPAECSKVLVAVVCGETPQGSFIAARILRQIVEKSSSNLAVIAQSVASGLRAGYELRLGSGRELPRGYRGSPPSPVSALSELYRSFRDKKQERTRFIQPLCNLWSWKEELDNLFPVDFYRFAAEAIAFLPFNGDEGQLLFITSCNRLVSWKGAHVLAYLKRASKGESLDEATLKKNTEAAGALCILLQLKAFLKSQYHISDARVKSFGMPKKKRKQTGKGAVPSDPPILTITRMPSFKVASGGWKPVYKQLKSLLAKGGADFAELEEEEDEDEFIETKKKKKKTTPKKRKQTTPKKKKKKPTPRKKGRE